MFGLTTRNNWNRDLFFDPFRELDEMERALRGTDRGFGGFRTDIIDDGDQYRLEADLPGFRKEDIHVDVNDGRLTISATRNNESEEKKDGYVRRERSYGSFTRSFDVSGIDEDAIKARYADGVLTLELPKKPEEKPQPKRIELV